MIIPTQSKGIFHKLNQIIYDEGGEHASVNAQKLLGCKTSPCINGKQYRVCVTRKTICREIPGLEDFDIPAEVICFPGDYEVKVIELDCRLQKFPYHHIVS